MNDRILNILKNIDNIGIIKFTLSKDHRLYLKKLLLDQDFLFDNILKNGGEDEFLKSLEFIYSNLSEAKDDMNNIKTISNNPDFQKMINEYFGEELERVESLRDAALSDYIKADIYEKNLKNVIEEKHIDDENKINEILNNLKNK